MMRLGWVSTGRQCPQLENAAAGADERNNVGVGQYSPSGPVTDCQLSYSVAAGLQVRDRMTGIRRLPWPYTTPTPPLAGGGIPGYGLD